MTDNPNPPIPTVKKNPIIRHFVKYDNKIQGKVQNYHTTKDLSGVVRLLE